MSRAIRKSWGVLKFDDSAIEDILNSRQVREVLREKAEEVASAARNAAPVDTGDYRDSIEVTVQQGKTRAHARVTATDEKSLFIESRYGVLRRALRGRGGRVSRSSQLWADRRQAARDRAIDRRTAARENAEES